MKKSILKEYASLLVRKGINVQPGQEVIIFAGLDQPEFVKLCVEEAYKCKAKLVKIEWSYQPTDKLVINKSPLKVLCEFTDLEKAKWQHRVDELPCLLYLESDDPDGLKGLNQEKATKSRAAKYKYIKEFRDKIENKYQWCIAGVPGAGWAKKIFPHLSKRSAIEALWEAILKTSRVDGNAIENWNKHNEDLRKRCAYLNSLHIKTLHYSAKNGTDFTVGMHDEALWCGGEEIALGSGIDFNPNIPSEECFTSPRKGIAEGIVYSAKPLSYNGEIIDKFSIRFHEGKAVEWHAEKNEDLLGKMLTIDEGASYLGECALIPFDSPIQNTGILFFNTLYDENASCHLAIGHGFTNCIKDYEKFTQEELVNKGINDSITHVDFMIGTEDMNIVGTTEDGKEIAIFRDGNWAF